MKIAPFTSKIVIGKNETCFSYLPKRAEEIDEAATYFLSQFPFVPNDKIVEDIRSRAWKIFKDANEDWDKIPEWVAGAVDGYVPYCGATRNGSLHHVLGLSVISRDAHLRCFWENIKNGTDLALPFPVIASLSE